MTDPDPNNIFVGCDVNVCYSGAKLADKPRPLDYWLLKAREHRLACSWLSAYKHLP